MSVAATSFVWERSESEGADRLVLLALADFADENGNCFGSWGKLEQKTRLSRATVARCLRRLRHGVGAGLIWPAFAIGAVVDHGAKAMGRDGGHVLGRDLGSSCKAVGVGADSKWHRLDTFKKTLVNSSNGKTL